jgi:hypothetical protein
MKAGKFYEAAGEYETAIAMNATNPLAYVGITFASLSAGETHTAAVQLRRAMELFPPIMETRYDVPRIVAVEALKREMNRLDGRLDEGEKKAEPGLYALSVFMHLNTGQTAAARQMAERLKAAAPEDKLFSAYATYVLNGTLPGQTTRPASGQK